jgi:polyhydroxyalkanoate synthesis repressor PhaR
MSTREIRKYPNRRLYDVAESRYITLHEIRTLVEHHEEFRVTDKKTGNDITGTVLLQVLGDAERSALAVMSPTFLADLIRYQGTDAHAAVGKYLEQSVQWLAREHEKPVEGAATPMNRGPERVQQPSAL